MNVLCSKRHRNLEQNIFDTPCQNSLQLSTLLYNMSHFTNNNAWYICVRFCHAAVVRERTDS